MLNNSLAPIKRAFVFFGLMGTAVACLTFGADLQGSTDQSSATVALAKAERQEPADTRYAAVDPGQKVVSSAKRAIATLHQATSQQAMLDNRPNATVTR
jgi:hypothetical protein